MSILIKGMEMPKNCKSCPLRYSSTGYAWCDITGESLALEIDMRDYTCPLVEIPTPHGRLIDADKIEYENWHLEETGESYKMVGKDDIDGMPTIIKAEGSET